MPILFNSLLIEAGLDPTKVRLIRHQDNRADKNRTPYRLWRDAPNDFMLYQSRQGLNNAEELKRASYWAVFVVTPSRDTLFIGLYKVGEPSPGEIGLPNVSILGAPEGKPYMVFPLEKSGHLAEFDSRLVIEWGKGFLKWAQRADTQNKVVLEIRREFKEEDWPGYLHFLKPLSEIDDLPALWISQLKSVKGVYALVCPRTKEHYVGSATGTEGFYGRWLQHLKTGGDAVGFKSREASDYQVSILEIAGSGLTDQEILQLEQLWMRKLQSRTMGINGNPPNLARMPMVQSEP
jgi:hypothetical protein